MYVGAGRGCSSIDSIDSAQDRSTIVAVLQALRGSTGLRLTVWIFGSFIRKTWPM